MFVSVYRQACGACVLSLYQVEAQRGRQMLVPVMHTTPQRVPASRDSSKNI